MGGKMTLQKHIGERFGYLTVLDLKRVDKGKYKKTYFIVKCDCGNTKEIESGYVKSVAVSCGCKTNELKAKAVTKHGGSYSRLYTTHEGMMSRCFNPNSCRYSRYGGRGITVCEEWRSNFKEFESWALQNGYRDDLTIERIDNDGNYEPNNCKWIPRKDQIKNRTFERGSKRWNSKLKETDIPEIRYLLSKKFTQQEIGDLYGVNRGTIRAIKNNETWRHA